MSITSKRVAQLRAHASQSYDSSNCSGAQSLDLAGSYRNRETGIVIDPDLGRDRVNTYRVKTRRDHRAHCYDVRARTEKTSGVLVNVKFTFGIWARVAPYKLRVPTTEPAAAFVEIVRLLTPIIVFADTKTIIS